MGTCAKDVHLRSMIRKILAVAVVVCLTACESKEVRLQRFLLQGNEALKEGNTDQAQYFYKEAIKVDPCYVDAVNNLGTVYYRSRDYQQAIHSYTLALECKPDFLNARMNRATSYYESGEYFSALADLEGVLKVKPDTAVAYFLRGLVLTKQREYQPALDAFEKVIALGSFNETECRVNMASVKYQMRRFDEARAELTQCIALNAKEPNIYNSLALIAIEEGKFDEALVEVNKAITLSPNQAYFVNNRGLILALAGRLVEAETDIDQAITLDPYNAYAYRNKGILMYMKQDLSAAERLLKKSLDSDSRLEKAHYYLGLVYQQTKRKAEACAEFSRSNEVGDMLVSKEQMRGCGG